MKDGWVQVRGSNLQERDQDLASSTLGPRPQHLSPPRQLL